MASHTGLEFARWILAPGKWVHDQATSFWNRYLYFVDIRRENDLLREELDADRQELARLRENATEVIRLRRLLSMTPPREWTSQGARIISQRLGPNAALETLLIDKGSSSGVGINTPVAVPEGIVGRVLRLSPSASTVLLITDPNSRIPVISQTNRTQGILKGEGPNRALAMEYVPQGAPVEEGEILVTSGLEEIFPKGMPVAKVIHVGRSGSSLFQVIDAEPLFTPRQLEEIGLLFRGPAMAPVAAPTAAPVAPEPAPPASVPAAKPGKGQKAKAAVSPSPVQTPAQAAPAVIAPQSGSASPDVTPGQEVQEGPNLKKHHKARRVEPR
ncbi:MAG: rod shape-determining protein MreC [Desulfovibrionaceae bacterium]